MSSLEELVTARAAPGDSSGPVENIRLRPYNQTLYERRKSSASQQQQQQQQSNWEAHWALRRQQYLRPLLQPVPWILPRFGIRTSYGEAGFWTLYTIVCIAILVAMLPAAITFLPDANSTRHHNDDNPVNDPASSLGTLGTLLMTLALLPVSRNGILTLLLNLSFERGIRFHRWLAYVAIGFIIAHGAAYIGFYGRTNVSPDGIGSLLWDGVFSVNLSGFISLCCAVALALTSLPWIRRHMFEFFYRVHIPLFLGFVVFAAIHRGTAIGILAVPILNWALGVAFQIRSVRKKAKMLSLKLLKDGVTRLEFDKEKFNYHAGQYVFICIPKLSWFEWHPFSISTSPHDQHVSLHVRTLGPWTASLAKLAVSLEQQPAGEPLPILLVDGPYGTSTIPLNEYKNFLLISGGIGVTPMQSIYNDLVRDWRAAHRELRHCRFIWSVRATGAYDYLLDEETQRSHSKHNGLGVLPPFHTPMLLDEYHANRAARGETQPTNEAPVLATEFYLTRGDVAAVQEQATEEGRQLWVRPGRPDLNAAFELMRTQHGGERRCAVLVCGPRGLVREVRRKCLEFGNAGMEFDLHVETFEL
ncbi:FAD-binding domain-containing protein [Fimicolochytrium jonesii]|uniref:FAD-binding domain-containing protein n=1 Tax=Fimicolochytrium jonesii TaxID=1396493 RepID=UPI0022FDEED0|nr:FAD-binding domain-containing protein [Fimicolochytrium jonesii]KAI8818321.1 FAD-binding domain-containing protein [Fimicolochytrium jonesii]